MKTEQLIVQYLYKNRKLTLKDIGNFSISPDADLPSEGEKDGNISPNSIQFEYDPKAGEDEGLIDFIVQQTRKIRPLAASDLDSYVMLSRQFLNIGKPMELEGLGLLQKVQTGEFEFTQSATSHYVPEDIPRQITEKEKEAVSFKTPKRESSTSSGKTGLLILIASLILGGAVPVWYFFVHNKDRSVSVATDDTAQVAGVDPAGSIPPAPKDSSRAQQAVTDTNSFYIVIKEFNTAVAAKKSYGKLTAYGNRLVLDSAVPGNFKLKMPFSALLSDTSRIRDSVGRFFGGKAYVKLP